MARGASMGGSGFNGGGGFHGGSSPRAGFHHPGVGGRNHVFFGHRPFVGHRFAHHGFVRPCCFGPRVVVGFGVPFWYPYGYAYPYPYPSYAPAVAAEYSAPTYLQQDYQSQPQQYWYYCRGAETYYPYVKECPSGWLTVVPHASPPPPPGAPPQ